MKKAISFADKCYSILRKIPRGKVMTYKQLAEAIGTKAYRAVGTAMAKNPDAPKVPCHRVVRSNGEVGEYAFGQGKKIAMLQGEGITIKKGKILNLERYKVSL